MTARAPRSAPSTVSASSAWPTTAGTSVCRGASGDAAHLPDRPQGQMNAPADIRLRPYAAGDLELLERLLGDPVVMTHLGGPETPEQLRARHQRYLADTSSGLFAVLAGESAVGWVGYWERTWMGDEVWECGWSVLPDQQGRGFATAGTGLLIERARKDARRRFLHAFPSVANPASNAICRKHGFTLLGEVDVEYPVSHTMRCNDWRLDRLDVW